MPGLFGRVMSATACLALAAAGCDSFDERDRLTREKARLESDRTQLTEAIAKTTQGKTTLTEQEKAAVTPLWMELREVEIELIRVKGELLKVE